MRRTSGKENASEYLRFALPLMARYAVPVTPLNYAVWYEYVSGTNLGLQQAVDELIETRQAVDEDVTQKLYHRHVLAFDEQRFDQARAALRSVVTQLGETIVAAGGEVSRYQESLNEYSTQLDDDISEEALRKVVTALSEETKSVHEASTGLHDRLEESSNEADALREELEKAKEEAMSDGLTGLANRRSFDQALASLQGHDDECEYCMLIADIDRFKNVNDTYGHLLGDKVIQFVGNTMKQCVKGRDLVARFGGEEFAVLLSDTPVDGARALAESIRQTIESGRLVRADKGVSPFPLIPPGQQANSVARARERQLW